MRLKLTEGIGGVRYPVRVSGLPWLVSGRGFSALGRASAEQLVKVWSEVRDQFLSQGLIAQEKYMANFQAMFLIPGAGRPYRSFAATCAQVFAHAKTNSYGLERMVPIGNGFAKSSACSGKLISSSAAPDKVL
jgi:hypothetical protein